MESETPSIQYALIISSIFNIQKALLISQCSRVSLLPGTRADRRSWADFWVLVIIEAVESTTWKHRCVSLRCLCPQPSWQPAEAPRRLSCQLILHLSFLDDPMQRQMDRTRRPGSLPRSQDNLPTPCKLPLNSITAFITRYSVSTQAAEPHVGHIVCCCCLEQNKLSPPLNLHPVTEEKSLRRSSYVLLQLLKSMSMYIVFPTQSGSVGGSVINYTAAQ